MIGSEEGEIVDKVEFTEMAGSGSDKIVIIEEKIVAVLEIEQKGGIEVSAEIYGDGDHRRQHFRAPRDATLLAVLDDGARKLDVKLLPNSEEPLDHLRALYQDHQVGEPLDLTLTLGEFLKKASVTHHFAIELVLAIRINTRWRVAPKKDMTPKAILELAGLSPAEFSLYFPTTSKEPLPPDTPVKLYRGQHFEAQRDGKYGSDANYEHHEG
jgi:hypothetical protein